MVWQHTAQTHNQPDIEAFGYGKGYLAALDTWRSFLDGVNAQHPILVEVHIVAPRLEQG